MISKEYRSIISKLSAAVIRKHFPGLNKAALQSACAELAVNIHARMYGANVDSVDSPIWFDADKTTDRRYKPNVNANDLLKNVE